MTLVLVQSSGQPVVGPPAPPGPPTPERELLLTSGHIISFAILNLIWVWALSPTMSFQRRLVMALVIAFTLGLVTELAQNYVPDRSASIEDLLVNWITTIVTLWWIRRKQGQQPAPA